VHADVRELLDGEGAKAGSGGAASSLAARISLGHRPSLPAAAVLPSHPARAGTVAASPIPAEELRPAPGVEVLMEELASARISGRMELVPAWSLSSSSRRSGAAGRRRA
jgi:hypothetical protein